MKKTSLLLFLFPVIAVQAQEDTSVQEAINEQVWKPFIQAYRQLDHERFNAIHTDDVLRVTPWGIKRGDEYKASNRASFQKGKAEGRKRTIAFCFEHRQARDDVAYEVGYYKITSFVDEGEEYHYARFHVRLRKEDGRWKIAQDWDTDEINGVAVTAQDFEKGADRQIK